MTLLLNLYLGHLLGDFVFQPGRLVAAKRKGARGLLVHVAIIGLSTSIILFADLGSLWYIILLAMGAHTLIEVVTIRARASTQLSGLSIFLIDQALHILSLVILVLVATSSITIDSVRTLGLAADPAWTSLACALILVTFMGSIVVFETSNSFGPDTWNIEILPYDMARLLGMIERGASLLVAVFVSPAALVVPFLPRVAMAQSQPEDEKARQMVIAAAGLIISVLGWAFVIATSTSARP